MQGADRKAAIAAYKERTPPAGVYAARCAATGQVWVGVSPDLDKIQNRLWFGLRLGNDPHADLQAAWKQHGGETFTFEIVERFTEKDAEPSSVRGALFKARLAYWAAQLGASAL